MLLANKATSKGLFITFEGPECAGKSTQVKLLADRLRQQGRDVLCTREPGGTKMAEDIRNMLLQHGKENVSPIAELLLFSASRAQHVHNVILPHLAKNGVIICDRFIDSTSAYQGCARGLHMDFINTLHRHCTEGRFPDLTFLLDLPLEETRRRLSLRSPDGNTDRMEDEDNAFHQAVRNGFLKAASENPERIRVIDATATIQNIADAILQETQNALARI